MIRFAQLNRSCTLVLAIAAILLARAEAVEIKGTVRSVSGSTATVAIEGESMPSVGDKADIFFKLAGAEDEISVASASVVKVDGDAVQLNEKASGDVAKDQLVRITSPNPQKRTAAVSTPTPAKEPPPTTTSTGTQPSGADPSFAFVDMNKIFKEYPKTKDAEGKINEARATAKKEYDERVAQKLPENELKTFHETREKEIQAEAQRMRTDLVAEMTASVDRLRGEADLILDKSGMSLNGVPVTLFSPVAADMSARVTSTLRGGSASEFPATRGVRIGSVDMNRVFKYYNKTKTAEAKINASKDEAKKEYDRRADAYKALLAKINDLDTQLGSSSAGSTQARLTKDRDNKMTQIKKMESEINAFRAEREKALQADALKMREGIVAEMTQALAKRLSGEQSAVIFDSSGNSLNGRPLVEWSSGIPDLSDDLIATLNKAGGSASGATTLVSSTELKVGCLDLDRGFKEMPETTQAEAEINERKNASKIEYDSRAADYKTRLDELNALNSQIESSKDRSLVDERDRKITAIKALEREINEFRTTREKELQDIALRKREAIVAKLTASVQKIGQSAGFNLIFDYSGMSMNGVPLLVFHTNLPDLTDEVIADAKGTAP